MIKATITYPDGETCTLRAKNENWDIWSLVRALEKCEIKKATIELDYP